MRREQKILLTIAWGLAVMLMLGFVAAGFRGRAQGLFDVPRFSLTDQTGKTITDADLRGNVWVAMVFFTQCPGVCPMMSAKMEQLQTAVNRPDVKIVSLSLDPEHDTPETMRAYAEKFSADASRWHMLTGSKEAIYNLAHDLKLVAVPAHDGQPILHTQKVLLIDRTNQVRGVYDTNDEVSMKQLTEDARAMASE